MNRLDRSVAALQAAGVPGAATLVLGWAVIYAGSCTEGALNHLVAWIALAAVFALLGVTFLLVSRASEVFEESFEGSMRKIVWAISLVLRYSSFYVIGLTILDKWNAGVAQCQASGAFGLGG